MPLVDLVARGLCRIAQHVLGGIEHPPFGGRTEAGEPMAVDGSRVRLEDGEGVEAHFVEVAPTEIACN